MPAIRTLVAIDPSADRGLVQEALPPTPNIDIVGAIEGLDESWSTLQETTTDLLVIACRGYSDRVLYFVEGALKQQPDRPVVVLAQDAQNGFVRRIFEAGADDVVVLPESAQHVAFVLEKAVARRQGAVVASGVSLAPLVCVLGPKGGTGKTLTAANLTVALATGGKRVVLVDLDLQFGDVGLSLGLAPEKTIYDLARSGGTLDIEKLDSYLMTHSSGARVLVAPIRPDQASFVTVDLLRDVYSALRANYDFVVVDTPPGFTPEVIASIDSSSSVVLVGMLDSLSLKNTKLGLETLELMGYDRSRIVLLLNRADTRIGISLDDVVAIVGSSPNVLVPSDREIARSVTNGIPIVLADERSEAAKAFQSLAALYTGAGSTNGDGTAEAHSVPEHYDPSHRPRRRLLRRR
jgi:pilus assembly protein CpaE